MRSLSVQTSPKWVRNSLRAVLPSGPPPPPPDQSKVTGRHPPDDPRVTPRLRLSGGFTPCRHLRPSSGREHTIVTYSVTPSVQSEWDPLVSGTQVGLAQVAAPRGGEEGQSRWSRSQSCGGSRRQGGKDRGTVRRPVASQPGGGGV